MSRKAVMALVLVSAAAVAGFYAMHKLDWECLSSYTDFRKNVDHGFNHEKKDDFMDMFSDMKHRTSR